MSKILDLLENRVLVCDGAMGSVIQSIDLDTERDFQGLENCSEILVKTRPDVVRDIHSRYFEAGADMVETNSFGGSVITLSEFGLENECFEINKRAAEIAREAANGFSDGKDRFVLGSIGPGTKLPSLGHIGYDKLESSYLTQCQGLISGGIDAFLIETTQDPLQFKAAVNAAKTAKQNLKTNTAIFLQVTVEATGSMLVGTDLGAAATIAKSLQVDSFGINCATGPAEMYPRVKWLSENWDGKISIQPNAGLPELINGETFYPLKPEEFARWHEKFVFDLGINIAGGCCGSTPDHIRAVDAMLKKNSNNRPTPVKRSVHWVPGLASLYSKTGLRQENAFLSIGERCNANGSKKFRELIAEEDTDGALKIAKDQVKSGAHTLDVCAAMVGRDEEKDMTRLVKSFRAGVNAPLVFDSTETEVIETALKLYAGKGVINSINFEDGEETALKRINLAKKFGAAIIALTIDENGMAKTCQEKVKIAKRLYDFACKKHGLPAHDLIFDPLTFTICTGVEDDRKLAIETLDAIEAISKELPDCQIALGLSNISFGLNAAARHVLNSVFLDQAVKRGMTTAIVHFAKIIPLHKIPEDEKKTALDLIYDKREKDYDPLAKFIELFSDRKASVTTATKKPETIEECLIQRIIDGDKKDIEIDIDKALKEHEPLTVINEILLGGMKKVGELFGSGQMQLPFVLQSAETMKTAVAYLEQFMPKNDMSEKGSMVLATVKGDVHDIGKNLVDIILSNNGYKVINIGIKQSVEDIISAVKEHKPDAIGMSGLLVKSTVIMRDNLEEMTKCGIDIPVILGGAALTKKYVEEDCVNAYGSGRVAYAKDAFAGLNLMKKVVGGEFDQYVSSIQDNKKQEQEIIAKALPMTERPVDLKESSIKKSELTFEAETPKAPFFGTKVIEKIDTKALLPFVNKTSLFRVQWGYKKRGMSEDKWNSLLEDEIEPKFKRILELCEKEDLIEAKAIYGYYPCAADGNELVIFDNDKELTRFTFPRQNAKDGICLSDFFRSIKDKEKDVIGLQIVTIGEKASMAEKSFIKDGRYMDYLLLHGLSVELAEACAEYIHKRIRSDLGYVDQDADDISKILRQGYQGARFSFGYPACPDLSDQKKLLSILKAERIGVNLSDSMQMHPEQSTSAIIIHHPKAKYFKV